MLFVELCLTEVFYIIVKLPSSNVAEFELGHVGGR